MRQTAKYTAGIATARKLGGKVAAGKTTHAALYDSLDAAGYWWDAGAKQWTDAPKPSTSMFSDDAAGSIPSGVVNIRVMTHPDESDRTVDRLLELLEDDDYEVITRSGKYENRKGVGVRVYLTVKKGGRT